MQSDLQTLRPGQRNPRAFLLPDESAEEYLAEFEYLFEAYQPVGAAEVRQLDLILRAEWDIERQYRMIRARLSSSEPLESHAAKVIGELHIEALQHQRHAEKRSGTTQKAAPVAGLNILAREAESIKIAGRYGSNRILMEIFQREITHAERRRRQAIELLHKMQDRRRRSTVEDAEILTPDGKACDALGGIG